MKTSLEQHKCTLSCVWNNHIKIHMKHLKMDSMLSVIVMKKMKKDSMKALMVFLFLFIYNKSFGADQ